MNYPEWILEFVQDMSQEDRDKHLLSYRSIIDQFSIPPEIQALLDKAKDVDRFKDFKNLEDCIGMEVTFENPPRLKYR